MENEKILCPYCGSEMERTDYLRVYNYQCPNCDSESPAVYALPGESEETTWDRASEAAVYRYQP